MSASLFWKAGALLGAKAIAFGAFGAHSLKRFIGGDSDYQRRLDNWMMASHYQLVHAAALLAVSIKLYLVQQSPLAMGGIFSTASSRFYATLPGYLFIAGILGFSGSIFLLTLDRKRRFSRILGPITPVGGMCLIAGWASLIFL